MRADLAEPRTTIEDLPHAFDGLPPEARMLALNAFNGLVGAGFVEDDATAGALGLVKRQFRQAGPTGAWVRVAGTAPPVPSVASPAAEPDARTMLGTVLDAAQRFLRGAPPPLVPESPPGWLDLSPIRAKEPLALADPAKRVTFLGKTFFEGKEIQIFPITSTTLIHSGRPLNFTREFLDTVLANAREQESREQPIPLDFNHGIDVDGAGDAAGFLKPGTLRVSESGMFAVPLYTEVAAAKIGAGAFNFISPMFSTNAASKTEKGKTIGPRLFAAALTNLPFLEGMLPVAMRDGASTPRTGEDDMKGTDVLAALGLKPGEFKLTDADAADAAKVLAAVKARLDAATSAEKRAADAESETKKLSDRIAAIEATAKKETATRAVDEAVRSGRVLPAQRKWADDYALSDPKGFAAFVETAPARVDFGEYGHGEAGPTGGGQRPDIALVKACEKAIEDGKAKTQDEALAFVAKHQPEVVRAYENYSPRAAS